MANVPHPLSLLMPVLPGTKMNDILAAQAAASEQAHKALVSIGTVHFARFLLLDTSQPNLQPDMRAADVPSNTLIMAVMTEYDGDFDAYIYDFVAQLGDVFNTNLQFVVGGAAVTPVQNNVAGFNAFIKANDASQHSPNTGMFAAYSQSVQQVLAAFS
jgi:hypothetical protein